MEGGRKRGREGRKEGRKKEKKERKRKKQRHFIILKGKNHIIILINGLKALEDLNVYLHN
jgi:hypothetical protein